MVTEIKQLHPPATQLDNEVEAYRDEVPIRYLKAGFSPTVPSEVLLGSLRDGRLKVHSPIKVRFTIEGQHTIAEAEEINEFGFGLSQSEAIIDLQRTIAELYFTLDSEREHLGRDLQRVWTTLQDKIRKHDD